MSHYRLAKNGEIGLHFSDRGLHYGDEDLVVRSPLNGLYEPVAFQGIRKLDQQTLSSRLGGLQAVANFLNGGEISTACIAAVHLQLPVLKAGYDDAEPRDDHGRWAGGGMYDVRPSHSGNPMIINGPQTASLDVMNDATPDVSQIKGTSSMDIDKAVAYLDSHAGTETQEACARYVENAIEHGGRIKLQRDPNYQSAKDKGPMLEEAGFKRLPIDKNSKDYSPEKGDVAIIQPYTPNGDGHIAMYNGKIWVSDFRQTKPDLGPYSGPGYRKHRPDYSIYRP